MPPLATLPIAVLVDRSGVDIGIIKSYERLGLLSKPRRTPSGLLLYPPDEVERITFIRRSLELGFSAESIREMLGIGRRKSLSCSDIYAIAERQLADIRRRIADLERMERALAPLVESCPRQGGTVNCNILAALSHPPRPATAADAYAGILSRSAACRIESRAGPVTPASASAG